MNKPENKCEIRLSREDTAKAVEMYLNDKSYVENIIVKYVKASRSKDYLIIAEFE